MKQSELFWALVLRAPLLGDLVSGGQQRGTKNALTSFYSMPLVPRTKVQAKVYAAYVEIWCDGQCVARYSDASADSRKVLNLEGSPGRCRSVLFFSHASMQPFFVDACRVVEITLESQCERRR